MLRLLNLLSNLIFLDFANFQYFWCLTFSSKMASLKHVADKDAKGKMTAWDVRYYHVLSKSELLNWICH